MPPKWFLKRTDSLLANLFFQNFAFCAPTDWKMQNDIVLNENEIAIAEKVLQHVIDNDDVFDSASMRNMRKKIAILMEKLEKKRYNGLSAKEYLVRKQVSAEKKARIAKQKNLDKNYIDKTLLRAQRKKTLNGLLQNSEVSHDSFGKI